MSLPFFCADNCQRNFPREVGKQTHQSHHSHGAPRTTGRLSTLSGLVRRGPRKASTRLVVALPAWGTGGSVPAALRRVAGLLSVPGRPRGWDLAGRARIPAATRVDQAPPPSAGAAGDRGTAEMPAPSRTGSPPGPGLSVPWSRIVTPSGPRSASALSIRR